ncbi:MAG: polysaccharide biosynthesis/export family protein [Planctomycetes bacterium]|nr:polysaccharide biosynthesis/export family protein [Planctomycetota bacterium]
MHKQPESRMLSIAAWLTSAVFLVAGCQTTPLSRKAGDSRLPVSLGKPTAPGANPASWQRSADNFSTATPGTNANDPVRSASFQQPDGPSKNLTPFPDLMPKEKLASTPSRPPVVPPTGHRLHGKSYPGPMLALPGVPNESSRITLPTYVIRPPDVLLIELLPQFKRKDLDPKIDMEKVGLNQPIMGPHAVAPDGLINLGVYGGVPVAGKTVQQAREEVARAIHARLDQKVVKFEQVVDNLKMSVAAYNSSVYYVITDGAGLGQQVYRLPVTGNETVLDAISHVNGLPPVSSAKRIWVARKNLGQPGPDNVLPVDWAGITQQGAMNTNWQLMPGDRVFVQADPIRRFNNNLGKILEPIERLFGATLLGGQAVNTIKNGTTTSVFR